MEPEQLSGAVLAAFTGGAALVGFLIGVAVTCMLTVARRADDWAENFRRKNGLPPED